MIRTAIAVFATGLLASVAVGQGFNSPPPATPGPFLPRFVAPIMPWGYSTGLSLNWSLPGGVGGLSVGGGLGLPYYTYYPPYTLLPQTVPPIVAPPLEGAGGSGPTIAVELPAELTVEFPSVASLIVNGNAMPGAEKTFVLKSSPLKAGQRHTFAVLANWTVEGKKFEWDREVTLSAGERGRVTVARGFPVED